MKKVVAVLFCIVGLQAFRFLPADESRKLTLKFKPVFGEKALVLEKEKYVSGRDTFTIDRFRFYISAVKLVLESGEIYNESESFHLLDADSVENKIVLKNIPSGNIKTIEFFIGIDSLTNVSGALGGDLDPANGMYWSWNSGYINAKLEGRCNKLTTLNNAFEFHIGGYLPPYCAVRKVTVPLNSEGGVITLLADASAWFRGVELEKNNSIVIPGAAAMKMADSYSKMFRAE
jgi:hypothetical protein